MTGHRSVGNWLRPRLPICRRVPAMRRPWAEHGGFLPWSTADSIRDAIAGVRLRHQIRLHAPLIHHCAWDFWWLISRKTASIYTAIPRLTVIGRCQQLSVFWTVQVVCPRMRARGLSQGVVDSLGRRRESARSCRSFTPAHRPSGRPFIARLMVRGNGPPIPHRHHTGLGLW